MLLIVLAIGCSERANTASAAPKTIFYAAETGDLAATQDLLGHESVDTTRIYTKVAAQRLADAHRQAFAR